MRCFSWSTEYIMCQPMHSSFSKVPFGIAKRVTVGPVEFIHLFLYAETTSELVTAKALEASFLPLSNRTVRSVVSQLKCHSCLRRKHKMGLSSTV